MHKVPAGMLAPSLFLLGKTIRINNNLKDWICCADWYLCFG